MMQLAGWMAQEITMPLWAFLVALLLPAAFFAKVAKETAMKKLGYEDNEQ